MANLRRAFVASSIVWAALLPLAPFAASQPAPARGWYSFALMMYAAGSFICHQMPARSLHSWAAQWPVCARCTGIYFGAATMAMVRSVRVRLKPDTTYDTRIPTYDARVPTYDARVLLALAALPTAATLIYEFVTRDTPSNAIRALAGATLGAAVSFVVLGGLRAVGKVN